MHYDATALGLALSAVLCFIFPIAAPAIGQRFLNSGQRFIERIRVDWQGTRYFSYGCILLLITAAIVSAYYLNNPQPSLYPDSLGYFQISHRMLTQGKFVDVLRTPVYP